MPRAPKKGKRPSRPKTKPDEAKTWKCDACGAYNDELEQFCNDCRAERIAAPAEAPEVKEEKIEAETPQVPEPPPLEIPLPEPSLPESPPIEIPLPEPALPEPISPEVSPEPQEVQPKQEPQVEEPKIEPVFEEFLPTPQMRGQGRYYMTFVNTPAQSLIKSKVPIDFDLFPVISIGRSPENVVVIPDQEVSRKHAELTNEGKKLLLRDLSSKNGTYLYNGKEFQQVSDSVEVMPNSILKFGTGTIVRLTRE